MLIHRIAAQLYTAEALQTVEAGLDAGEDVTLAVSQSGRTLMAAAQFARRPRPTVYVVSGEDAADRAARSLAAYVGLAHVCRFPERKDYPWREQVPDDAVVAQRCEALGRIVRGDNCIMVASARALLRCVPPVESRYWESTTFAVGEEIPFDEVPQRLVGMGYTNAGAADAPGLFRVHGDTVEVFPAQEKAPVRIEFFGDEIDRIRRMVSSTGQTIGNEDSIEIFPCRELALTDEAVHNMHVALYRASQDDSKLAALLEMVDARIVTPELDRFLPVMYGQTVSPLAHVSGKALVVLSEPRSLFDDCLRAYEDIEARAGEAGIDRLDGLYVRAQQLDFGAQQRLNYVSLIRAGGAVTAELKIEQPAIAGSDNRFMTRIQEVVGKRYACVFAIPDRGARESMELTFGDEGITFEHIRMDEVLTPFVVNSFYFCDKDGKTDYVQSREALPVDDRTPGFGATTFCDIEATNCHAAAAYITGLPESKVTRLTFQDVHVTFADDAEPFVPAMACGVEPMVRQGIIAQNVKVLDLQNVVIEGQDGEELQLQNVDKVVRS